MATREGVILVGHGGVPHDMPRDLVLELKELERERRRRGEGQKSDREAELDRTIRNWPRTPETDPYKSGLEAIAGHLRPRLGDRRLVVAYNEFCAPSLEEAVVGLVDEGITKITVLTTMFTRGGSHSEFELPSQIQALQRRHPDIEIRYAWPYRVEDIAAFLLAHIEST